MKLFLCNKNDKNFFFQIKIKCHSLAIDTSNSRAPQKIKSMLTTSAS